MGAIQVWMIHWLFGRIFNIPQIPSQEQATPLHLHRQASNFAHWIPNSI